MNGFEVKISGLLGLHCQLTHLIMHRWLISVAGQSAPYGIALLRGCVVGKVVDRDYRVIGIDGFRVVDGSTFSVSPGTNPQATLMMLERYVLCAVN